MSGSVVLFPIFSILLLADPNSMWYLSVTSFVILSNSCSSFGSFLIRAISSIHVVGIQLVLLRSQFWGLYFFFVHFLVYVIFMLEIVLQNKIKLM